MKTVIAGLAAVAVTPFVAVGLVAMAFTSTDSPADGCSSSAAPCDVPAAGLTPQGAPAAFSGPDGLVDDPTTTGRITRRMLHVYLSVQQAFGTWPWGITCWDAHAWNPASDHPLGRACDFTVGHIGQRPSTAEVAQGWELAHWAETNSAALGIIYIIWQGHIWSPTRASQGWRPYNGGGIYNPTSITGGHYDHVHISVEGN